MSKNYFSGFSLEKEEELFSEYSLKNDFTVAGFSYGAQRAFDYVINTNDRVDLLQLFSPAFFQNKDKKYKRMQVMYFKKDPLKYSDNFLSNSIYPSAHDLQKYFTQGSYEDLETLLNYHWSETKLELLLSKGVKIEVFLGCEDKIIDALETKKFFQKYANVYMIKNAGHILKVDEL